MFPEMVEEFGTEKYPASSMHVMEVDPDSEDNRPEYELSLEYPYGSYTVAVFFKEVDKEGQQANADGSELQALPENLQAYFHDHCTPEPISREMQRELDDKEEKDNKEKEREARQAQKELEQRKARQKAEA